MRIGHGYDVHAFAEPAAGAEIVLCGVRIAHTRPLRAHSDGDVALHALTDALLGAAALPDIGQLFSDQDPQWKNADSTVFVREALRQLREKSLQVSNIDLTLIAQSPKMAPHIQAMRARLAAILELSIDRVNVKATTTEGLGFAGREEGIAAHAVVLLNEA
ncbi:MAG: 2-C-methyl-D-erythritol 2,4-cyclodiphosphate synthase [Gammaproteobacteria bacterium]